MAGDKLCNELTKHYIEIQPGTEPSDVSWYQNVINTRQYTMRNIVPLCRVSSTLTYHGWLHHLLQSEANARCLFDRSSVENQVILEIEFLYDVWLSTINILVDRFTEYDWASNFKWQGWNGSDWIDVGNETATTKLKHNSFLSVAKGSNECVWQFPNLDHSNKKYIKWRAFGIQGTVDHGYINAMFLHIIT